MQQVSARHRDPAPSRLSYRLQRLALTPGFRRLFTIGLPLFAAAFIATLTFIDADRRASVAAWVAEIRASIEEREEFQVREMSIEGATESTAAEIRAALPSDFPLSSFELDLPAMRAAVEALDAVERVDLRVRPGGVLQAVVLERKPVLIWRDAEGLQTLDRSGHRTDALARRSARPDLPIVSGLGADAAVPEALALFDGAGPIGSRLRGLVRVGERRWDVVLDDGRRILLPERDAVAALEQAIALDEAQDLFARDVTLVDLRNPRRPTIRIAEETARSLRQIKLIELGDD